MSGKIITIGHQKGGVGKSTIASNLAVDLSKEFDVNVLDLDVQKSLSAFGVARGKNDLKFLSQPSDKEELMKIMNNHKCGILLIDTGGFDMDIQRIAMYGADLILTPVSDSPMELHGLSVFSKTISKLRESRPEIKASIILNRVHPFAGKSLDELLNEITESEHFEALGAVLRDRKAYKEAFYFGKSVTEFQPDGEAAGELKMLIDEIKRKLSL